MGKAGAEETAKKSEEKKRVLNRFFQRKRYKDAYRAARTGNLQAVQVGRQLLPALRI